MKQNPGSIGAMCTWLEEADAALSKTHPGEDNAIAYAHAAAQLAIAHALFAKELRE